MALLELDDVKTHLSIAAEDTTEDAYLTGLLAAAEATCQLETGRWINPANKPASSAVADFSASELDALRHAARLLIGSWYLNREEQAPAGTMTLPMGAKFLLARLADFSDR